MTSSGLEILDPGEVGREWVRRRLEAGLTLSRLVLESVSIALEVETARPAGAVDQGFELGLAGGASEASTRAWVVDQIRAASSAGGLVVAEDRLSRKGDPALETARARLVFFGDEVYVRPQRPSSGDLEALVDEAQALHGFAAFVGESGGGLGGPGEPSLDDLRRYASSVHWIGVDAYDGEGYVVGRVRP